MDTIKSTSGRAEAPAAAAAIVAHTAAAPNNPTPTPASGTSGSISFRGPLMRSLRRGPPCAAAGWLGRSCVRTWAGEG